MDFLREVSEEEFQEIEKLRDITPSIPENWTCYWVKVSKNDFLHNIHIVVQGTPQNPIGWERFAYDTCLGCYSQRVHNSEYRISDELMKVYPKLQTENFDVIKYRVEHFSREKMLRSPLWYQANTKAGPYMIWESVRRHIAAYIYYFILEKEELEPISYAICMLPDDEKFNRSIIPNKFC